MTPFVKDGRTVPNAFVWCDCYEEERHHYSPKPGDFNFPMSSTFRAFTFEYCGFADPGHVPALNLSEIEDRLNDLEAMSAQAGAIPRQYYNEFQQIRAELAHLRNKIATLSTRARPVINSS